MPLLRGGPGPGIMKRRAKLSLRRSSQKVKKPNTIDNIPEIQGHLNKATQSLTSFVASLSTSSCQQTAAEIRSDSDITASITETSRPESAPLDHPNGSESACFDNDCGIGSQDCPADTMSCEAASVCDMDPGSGHQMEIEGDVEEYGDTADDAIPSSSISSDSKAESNSEEVDCVVDPTPEIDLCTQYCDDHSNPALYSLTNDDIAQFEDFSVPRHTEQTQSNPSIKRQTSLLSFMSRTSRSSSESPSTTSMSKQRTGITSLADSTMPNGKGRARNRVNGQSSTGSQVSGSSEGSGASGQTKRTCPFYKRIPGTV